MIIISLILLGTDNNFGTDNMIGYLEPIKIIALSTCAERKLLPFEPSNELMIVPANTSALERCCCVNKHNNTNNTDEERICISTDNNRNSQCTIPYVR